MNYLKIEVIAGHVPFHGVAPNIHLPSKGVIYCNQQMLDAALDAAWCLKDGRIQGAVLLALRAFAFENLIRVAGRRTPHVLSRSAVYDLRLLTLRKSIEVGFAFVKDDLVKRLWLRLHPEAKQLVESYYPILCVPERIRDAVRMN